MKKHDIILKHDDFVAITNTFNSIDESRFINSILGDVYQRELLDKQKYYPINVVRYADKSGISLGQAFTELRELAIKYKETTLEIPLKDKHIWYTSIIYDFIVNEDNKTIFIQWNKEIIPLISGDMEKGYYGMYIADMDNSRSIANYKLSELIQRNLWLLDKKGEFILETSEIRKITGTESKYKVYSDLRKRIIQPAIDELGKYAGIRLLFKGNSKVVKFWRKRYEREVS